jgi:lipopolysaccharide biosynthesis glycosyltransferase
MEEIAVVLAADDNYAQHGAVACASILANHKQGLPVHFYFFSDVSVNGRKRPLRPR